MSFIHLWAIAIGSVALAAPLVVHFLTRPRPVTYPLSTIRLLRGAIQQRRARSRLRDLIILLLRMLAVALLALTLARPLLKGSQLVPLQAAGNTSRVVLVDVSQSMSAGTAGSTAIARAQAAALEYLDYAPGLQADVVLVGAKPRSVFDRLSANLASLRESVRQVSVRAERADVKAAMDEAARLLDATPQSTRELVIISDFQRGNWGTLFLDRIPEGTRVQMESVAEGPQANVAITSVRFPTQPVAGKESILEVEVANHSDEAANVRCRVDLGAWQQTLESSVPARSTGVLSAKFAVPSAGWLAGWARLDTNADALLADDVRPIAVSVAPQPRVLLVSRQPAPLKTGSSFYLEQALRIVVAPGETEGNRPTIERIQPQRVDLAAWPEADLFVLNQPGALDAAAVERIAARIRRGGGLLYFVGGIADGLNVERLTESLGSGFQPPVQLIATGADATRKDLFVRRASARVAPFQTFGDAAVEAMKTVRIGGGLATRATSEGLRDQILGELSDTTALVYVTSCDAGQVGIVNADLDQSNWCVQSTFLPVVGELVQTLLSGHDQASDAFCGEPLARLLPTEIAADAALVAAVADERTPVAAEYGRWEWSAAQGSLVWMWNEPAGAGVYQLFDGDRVAAMVATAAPPVEADLATLDRATLQGRLAGSRPVGFRRAADDSETEDHLWNWLVVGCIVGLASEMLALRWFRA